MIDISLNIWRIVRDFGESIVFPSDILGHLV